MTLRDRYIRDHAPTMLLIQALRAVSGGKLDLDAAIRAAGALWDRIEAAPAPVGAAPRRGGRLSEKPEEDGASGRGRPSYAKPRSTVDHYSALPDDQRAGFDAFYAAYGLAKGKQRAAARWAQIAPDAGLAKRIAAAAAHDRAQPRAPDAARKYPEGWLSERRWEDAPLPGEIAQDPAAQRAADIRELVNERAGLRRLAAAGDPTIAALLADIEARLAALVSGGGGG